MKLRFARTPQGDAHARPGAVGVDVSHHSCYHRADVSSCDPNTYVETIAGVPHVVARRPIRSGEEVTCDYVINCHGGDVWGCNCGSPRCRGTIVSSFFELPLNWQLEYLLLLDGWFVEEHGEKVGSLRRIGILCMVFRKRGLP